MKLKILTAISASAILFLSGCDKLKDFDNTNVNPNGTTVPSAAALLTNVEAGVGSYGFNTRGGLYCQYFSETQYTDVSLYSIPQIDFVGTYTGSLADLQNIINLNVNSSQTAVAKILKSYILWIITDQFGSVPYSQALTGGLTAPGYDKQEEIYKGLISDLTTAVGMFDGNLITGDIIFNGNQDRWKKTANSIRMLMAMRLSNVYPGAGDYAATEFKAALSAGVITDNTDNFMVKYPGGNFQSPIFAVYNGREDYGESETMTNITSGLSDPRQQAFGGISLMTTGSSSTGVPYGLKRDDVVAFTTANPGWARILEGSYRTDASSIYLVTAAQTALARAEAAQRGWTNETASSLYQQGITASFVQWGIGIPSESYLGQSKVSLAAGDALYKIQLQRYIATYPDGMQGWSEWRRTGVPELAPAPDATNGGIIPTRYRYGQTENSTNPGGIADGIKDLDPKQDVETAHVWWDK
ncbi:MAG TPA: SusD/RagB family nutrient-binding outer membrane lipoprotein [Parafilimonas sp.]|nr:SusD/RagB family nutrient-binding outer membrane lipoprotein [Parafilimonas sp.]